MVLRQGVALDTLLAMALDVPLSPRRGSKVLYLHLSDGSNVDHAKIKDAWWNNPPDDTEPLSVWLTWLATRYKLEWDGRSASFGEWLTYYRRVIESYWGGYHNKYEAEAKRVLRQSCGLTLRAMTPKERAAEARSRATNRRLIKQTLTSYQPLKRLRDVLRLQQISGEYNSPAFNQSKTAMNFDSSPLSQGQINVSQSECYTIDLR